MGEARERVIRVDQFDDGVNAWSMARIAPPPALVGVVTAYSDYRETTGGFAARRELPNANGVLIVNFGAPIEIVGGDGATIRLTSGEGFVGGAHLRHAVSRSTGAQAGIHVFLPMPSLRALVGVPMGELLDRVVPLDALVGPAARQLCRSLAAAESQAERIALLDAALSDRFASRAPIGGAQSHAVALLERRPDLDIAAIARGIGWSRKHLADRVRDAVGVGPRSYRRLLRFDRLIGALDPAAPDWAGLAAETGYCDQSHLIREFREFAGMTPGDYCARVLPGGGGGLVEP